jgi:hypothetical protein
VACVEPASAEVWLYDSRARRASGVTSMTEIVSIPVQPQAACPNCWRAWLVGPRSAIGYCWHGKMAWRVKAGGVLAVEAGVTREEYRAMLEYVNEMQLVAEHCHRVGDVAQGMEPGR